MPVGEADWHGGQTLIDNSMRALHEVAGDRVRIVIVGGSEPHPWSDGVVAWTAPRGLSPRRAINRVALRLSQRNLLFERALHAAKVDVLLGERVPWRMGSIATVSWLQDFQHRHLPELFNGLEVRRRNRAFAHTMRICNRALAMSESLAVEASQLAPREAPKLRVVQPWSLIEPEIYQRDPNRVTDKYALPPKFFYVPNQFWAHKNHRLLLEALRIARERGKTMQVVLTGRTEDYRRPDHFQRVMALIHAWGLSDQVRYLGVVERAEVYDLIRQSIAVINPSRFEGWGYAVDEAAAVGKRILASDLSAHREQTPPACDFFDPRNADELAQRMEHLWLSAEPGPSLQLESAARERMPLRLHDLGSRLLAVLQEVVPAFTWSARPRMVESVSA